MKRKVSVGVLVIALCLFKPGEGCAQIPIADIIKEAIIKVIKAVDLQVQRLQNKTIWLQNAQKTVENKMTQLKLNEISNWVERQRKLYADYFEELRKVKSAIASYHRVKDIIARQVQLVNEYKSAYALFKRDKNFTADELDYMGKVYAGILDQSLKNVDQLYLVINSFVTQMNDAKRLEIVNNVSERLDQNLADLRQFNNSNKMLSLQRAAEQNDIDVVRKLYGL
jgi:hypothetical protein